MLKGKTLNMIIDQSYAIIRTKNLIYGHYNNLASVIFKITVALSWSWLKCKQ